MAIQWTVEVTRRPALAGGCSAPWRQLPVNDAARFAVLMQPVAPSVVQDKYMQTFASPIQGESAGNCLFKDFQRLVVRRYENVHIGKIFRRSPTRFSFI